MDTILDKLSQKLTAQEIIKANTEADAKELERIQQQVQQYNNCLEEMKKVNGQTKESLAEIGKTLQAGLDKFQNAEIPTEGITKLVEESLAQIQALQKESVDMQSALDEKLSKLSSEITDYVHKECVKVYRNIQAVQVEENNKQTESLTAEIAKATGKAKAAWGVSVATLIFSVLSTAGVVFMLLHIFNLLPF